MKILIAGGGKVGYSVAETLSAEGHDITVIDRDPEVIEHVSNTLDVICVLGAATNHETLREAGAAQADLLLAATEQDEVNMVCGITARKLGTRHVAARVRDPEYLHQTAFLQEALGLSLIINPEYECAREISRILRFPSASRVDTFSKGSVEIVEYRVPEGSRLHGMSLKELPRAFGARVLVVVLERGGEALIPNGDFVLRSGDVLSLSGSGHELRKFFEAIGQYRRPVKNLMIMGGGRIAVYLTRMMEDSGISVTVVERDEERCEKLCDLIPHASVICGDATRSDVLVEEGIARADAFAALTGEDGDNIIISMYARSSGVPKIVTKVNREHFSGILESAGLESVVTPKELVAQQLTRYVRALDNSRGGGMETLHRLADGKAEALEFRVGEDSKLAGTQLKDLKLKKNVLIGAVIRGGRSIIPNGLTALQPGDHAVIVTAAGRLTGLDQILEGEK
ncbi:MAG: Trk system potassium transporter TrkA [Oscillospiraceae bacterium]|nr:Trk system potassium transporter TrkA [Oscillospiraceae bacterium]